MRNKLEIGENLLDRFDCSGDSSPSFSSSSHRRNVRPLAPSFRSPVSELMVLWSQSTRTKTTEYVFFCLFIVKSLFFVGFLTKFVVSWNNFCFMNVRYSNEYVYRMNQGFYCFFFGCCCATIKLINCNKYPWEKTQKKWEKNTINWIRIDQITTKHQGFLQTNYGNPFSYE